MVGERYWIPEWGSWLCLLTALLFTMLALMQKNRRKPKIPPGPPALPIIGHMHLLAGASHPADALAHLSKRYGPLLSLKLGSIPSIVASTPETARQILQAYDHAFAFRTPLAATSSIYDDSFGITFADLGPNLRFLRQLCASDLFNTRRLQAFKPLRDQEVRVLLQSIFYDVSKCAESVGSRRPVHLRPLIQAATNNIISRMMIGDKTDVVRPVILEASEAISTVNIGDFFPWIQWADLQGCVKRCRKAAVKLHAALQDVIELRRAQRGGSYDPPADMLDMLLSASLVSPPDVKIKDAHIRATLFDIFGGGTDTSSIVLEWAMAELLASPSKLKAAEEEVLFMISSKRDKNETIEEDDIQRMPYLRAVVKETMRLHPVLPLLLPRESRQACNILEYEIPAKTQAFVNIWAIGRDPKVWDSPKDFLPERFLDNNIDVRGRHFELLPFGSGRRVCPGQSLGLLSIHIILARLLHAFSWSPHDLQHDMSEKFGLLITKATPLVAYATPRLPSEFYML
ncbi:hypothetical protein L7F22_052420 [Adiantum nelumboides]|nr:hypothetical protein [Adiantum nelumboides]